MPLAFIDEVVEFWDEVVDWATTRHISQSHAGVAVRRAAIHAARALCLHLLNVEILVNFVPVFDAFERLTIRDRFALKFHKSSCFAHKFKKGVRS